MTTTTASTSPLPPLSIGQLKEAIAELEKLKPKRKEWLLMAPDGRVWSSEKAIDIANVIALEVLQIRPLNFLP